MKLALRRKKHVSPTGFLAELVSVKYKDTPFGIHSYLVKINEGCLRANHYHEKKEEWMSPIFGKTKLDLFHIKTKQKREFLLDFDDTVQKIIHIPPFWAHSVKAVAGNSGIIVFSEDIGREDDVIPYKL